VKRTIVVFMLLALAANAGRAQRLSAAGATFPYPIYSKWFAEYAAAHPGVEIHYRPIGSGEGIRQVAAGLVDFGATDAPMTDSQLAASRIRLIHIPALMGAVVPIHNVPGVSDLRFSGEVLADIYQGKITNWNDQRIVKDNPGAHLPDRKIVVVHRSDSSGTSYIFTDYLTKVSRGWASGPGRSAAPSWPVGVGAVRNQGVAHLVSATDGALGYVELIYALQNHISFGAIRNPAGHWLRASIEGIAAAAASVADESSDYRVSITNAPWENSYPISSFTWLLVPRHSHNAAKTAALKGLLSWIVTKGQDEASSLSYAPLPRSVAERVLHSVSELQ
jgi:phosphate transport system substrate-binding protein